MTIDKYITISVTDCKRLGYFKPNATCSGVLRWNNANGGLVASVGFATLTTGVPVARIAYNYNGRDVETEIRLMWKRSNLRPDAANGYYYFVCPETGALCRKLYLVNGRFVGRKAVGALYPDQTKTHAQRRNPWANLYRTWAQLSEMEKDPHRRKTYNGQQTPFGRRFEKLTQRAEVYGAEVERCEAAGIYPRIARF